MRAIACTLLLALALQAHAYTFWTLGDWGGADIDPRPDGSSAKENVAAVAAAMKKLSASTMPEFLINTGDSFYFCGIWNTTDEQIASDWVDPFVKATGLTQLTWYSALGNHEYGYNASAVVALSKVFPQWYMPQRYFMKRIPLSSTTYMTMVFLDTTPLISDYRGDDESQWDPCGGSHPTCAGGPVEGQTCNFHANVLSQSVEAQEAWIKQTLAAVDPDDWLIVVGHHKADTVTEFDLASLLQQYHVDLYLNGHVHLMDRYTVNGEGNYITSGAGSLCSPAEASVDGGDAHVDHHDVELPSHPNLKSSSQFSKTVAGFVSHTFNSDFTTLSTTYYDNTLYNLYSFDITRNGPGPTPPPPSGSCCHYDDASCSAGQVCCKTGCSDPTTCSYTHQGCDSSYAKKHSCEWDATSSLCVVA